MYLGLRVQGRGFRVFGSRTLWSGIMGTPCNIMLNKLTSKETRKDHHAKP